MVRSSRFFATASEAYVAGYEQYGLGNFSLERVGTDPIDLGVQTLAIA